LELRRIWYWWTSSLLGCERKRERMNECFRALFGPDAFRPLVEYDAVSIDELLTTFRLSFLRPYVDLSFSQWYWWISSLLGHDAISNGEFYRRFGWACCHCIQILRSHGGVLRNMTPYRLANFYRLDDIPAYIFMVSAAQGKCIDAKFFGSKLVNVGSFLPGDTQSSQQTRIACSSLLWQRDVKQGTNSLRLLLCKHG